jgi:hypothetical protein
VQAWGGPWYGVPLKAVQEFKYLGRLLSRKDDDWPAVHRNLSKDSKSWWAQISCILATREGATPRVSGMFYKVVVQLVMLFGPESWVLSQPMLKALEGFHWRVARRLAGKQPYLDLWMGDGCTPLSIKFLKRWECILLIITLRKDRMQWQTMWPHGLFLTFAKNQSGRQVHTPAGDGGTKSTEFSVLKTLVMMGNKSV